MTRRQLLTAKPAVESARHGQTLAVALPDIHPRDEWAQDRPPLGPSSEEEVRFLIVHHSASHNGHSGAETPSILRGFYDFHTSSRGWNDIAYNFLIDADGWIWEGRAGSLEGPVAGDATGGNQGFSQLVCVIGDYDTARPSNPSLTALVALLAGLADRHDISTAPGSQVSFVSRGSNRHPAGSEVVTPTIVGHRAMSLTSCPGENLNAYVADGLMSDVTATRTAAVLPPTTTSVQPPTTTTQSSTTSTADVDTTAAPSTVPSPSTTASTATATPPLGEPAGIIAGAGAVVLLGIGAAAWRYRRMRRD